MLTFSCRHIPVRRTRHSTRDRPFRFPSNHRHNAMALHTASTADSGLSLWLSPPSAATSSPLQDYIGELARRTVPSKDAEPIIFAPHTTLVSDKIVPALEVEDVLDKIKAGVQEWRNGGGGGGDGGAKGLKLRFKKVQQGASSSSSPIYTQLCEFDITLG